MRAISNAERAVVVVLTALVFPVSMSYIAHITTDRSSIDIDAASLVFIPYAVGPVLVAAFRTTSGRSVLYSTAVLTILSPLSNLLFIAGLVVAILPRIQSSGPDNCVESLAVSGTPAKVGTDTVASSDIPKPKQESAYARILRAPTDKPLIKPSEPIPRTDPRYLPTVSRPHVEWVRYMTAIDEPIETIMGKVGLSRSTVKKIQYGRYDHLA